MYRCWSATTPAKPGSRRKPSSKREASGFTPRPDVHGIDIWDEADGPTFAFRAEAKGIVVTPIARFLDTLKDSSARPMPA